MSGTQVSSSVPLNILYDSISGKTGIDLQSGQNQLLQQQQDIGGHEMEMASRLAGTLLSQYTTPEARAAAYPTLLANARAAAPGYFKNAPSSYPGDDATHALFQLGTSSAEQFKLGQAGTAIPTPGFNTGAAAPAVGGGTAAAPGDGLTGDREHDRALIVARESGGDPTALNYVAKADPAAYARGATASGKYQFVNSTWREGMQLAGLDPAKYPTAREAPEAVQDQVFNAVYGKYGAAPWQKGPKDWIKDEQGQYQLATVRPAAQPAAPGGGVVARNPGAVQVAGPGAGTPPAAPGAGSGTTTAAQAPLPPDQAKAKAAATGQPVPVAGVDGLWALPSGGLVNQLPATAQAQPAAPPAAPASPAPQPPAATAPPLVAPVAVPAPDEMDGNHLTRQDYKDLDRAKRSGMTGPQLTQEVQQRQNANLARQEKYRGDVRQAQNDAQAANEKAKADAIAAENLRLSQEGGQRDTERLRLAQQDDQRKAEQLRLSQAADQRAAEKAAQEAKAASRPVQGNDVDAQHESYLYEHANEIRDGSASEEVKRQYAGSYYALQQRGGQALQITDPNNPGGTIAATITRRLPSSLPEPPGGALPEVLTTPGAAKAPQMTEPQSQAAGFADRMVNALPIITDTSPAAMSRWQQLLGKVPLAGNSFVSSEFQQHIQAERDFINAVLRKESGAAISESEFVNARQQYIPQPGDQPAVLAQKAKNRETVLANLTRDAGPAYKPPTASSSAAAVPPPPKGFKVIQ